jgi:Mg-chelatase subunit ChlD
MTKRGIRCGYTLVEFTSGGGHAIVAFNTDYGLVFIEPQSGNTEYSLGVGSKYPYSLQGVPDNATIAQIAISWNDAVDITFRECRSCSYVLPIYGAETVDKCPICGIKYDSVNTEPRSGSMAGFEKNIKPRRGEMTEEKYKAEISRRTPGCILFLIDQSESMADNWAGERNAEPKAKGAANILNRLLTELINRCTKGEEVRHYFDVGIIGYGEVVGPALGGELAGHEVVPINQLEDYGRPGESEEVRVWLDPIAKNRTPMCQALREAHRILSSWITDHRESYPPIVINITDGEANDGDPLIPAQELMALNTNDGNVLLFNCHLSSRSAATIQYPGNKEGLADEFARKLYDMSNILPDSMVQVAKKEFNMELDDMARGFIFNAEKEDLMRFLVIGTRPGDLSLR